jgi:hypothetical protein
VGIAEGRAMNQCVEAAGQDHVQALIAAFRRLNEEKHQPIRTTPS